jgi:predicted DNA binding protein
MFSHRELQSSLQDQLTDRQREVLTAAHEAGYYTWPREITGEELADELDISSPTLHEHLRAAEQTLIAMVFDSTVVQSPHGPENTPT